MSTPLATIGILSIGDMGVGIARLLIASGYRVVTNVKGRSEDTHARVLKAAIEPLDTDQSFVKESDYILSIVPPRDALGTAQRILKAYQNQTSKRESPLYYLDLNAISPRSVREINSLFETEAPEIKFIDGGIIGSPPTLKESDNGTSPSSWNLVYIPLSGPHQLSSSALSGKHLQDTLNAKHITPDIGSASGLKCCFATTTKGFAALCIQAFTTAKNLGVLDELVEQLAEKTPAALKSAERGVTGMAPKAYRWVREMEEIAITHSEDGGFDGDGKGIFDGVAEVYRAVAEDTILGQEKTESRKRGRTILDVAEAIGEGLQRKKRKKV